jgi:GxxExxY protein
MSILYKELSYEVVGAAMEVHSQLGPGFLEAVYQSALAHELSLRGIPHQPHRRLTVTYKGKDVGYYEADIVVDDKIILELKAVSRFHASHTAQAIHYLKATGLRLAICSTSGLNLWSMNGWLFRNG